MAQVKTPVGNFARKTEAAYTHAVVWDSPRARATVEAIKARNGYFSGVDARWNKDRGYGVTWHTSEEAARKAATKYKWDTKATLVGIFEASL